MTYEEKLAELARLKAEVAGRPHVLGSWESMGSWSERHEEDDFEPETTAKVESPAIDITDEEIRELFPNAGLHIKKGECMGRAGLPAAFVDRLYKSYCKGYSLQAIGKRVGRSRQTIFETFKRRGFKLRPNSKALKKPDITYNGSEFSPTKGGYLRETKGERRLLHWVVWEEFNGPIPAGHQITFKDGNNRNFSISNLALESRKAGLRRVCTGENRAMKNRRLAIEKGEWTPSKPNKYDLAFLTWFRRHGWLVRESMDGSCDVWTTGDAVCKFRVTGMMLERLVAGGLFSRNHGSNRFIIEYGIVKDSIAQAA
ncbi:MAG TPA: HNH endonuclease signature motif containing protein [Verrucomicrobiae bacterium]|nr:HNH endonuclease signature motif containing protein [Verrucomicrobiae bacterium]